MDMQVRRRAIWRLRCNLIFGISEARGVDPTNCSRKPVRGDPALLAPGQAKSAYCLGVGER